MIYISMFATPTREEIGRPSLFILPKGGSRTDTLVAHKCLWHVCVCAQAEDMFLSASPSAG